MDVGRSIVHGLKTGPAASLTLNFFATLLDQTFAFAIFAFQFWFACVLLHVRSKSNADPYYPAGAKAIDP
jgi:hypothetical protein